MTIKVVLLLWVGTLLLALVVSVSIAVLDAALGFVFDEIARWMDWVERSDNDDA